MREVLFFHCARLYPLAPAYTRQQLAALQHNHQQQLNYLARACQYFARQRVKGRSPDYILARLVNHPALTVAAELITQALLNLQVLAQVRERPHHKRAALVELPFPLLAEHRPTQPGLLRALLRWPDNDGLLPSILATLAKQPVLSLTLRRYATNYTKQQKLLELKPALLLLGPQRSRELVLLAQFETLLLQPVFPLKPDLLQRHQLIHHMLALLAARFNVSLPARSELLAYLLIYDAWRSPEWLIAGAWSVSDNFPVYRVEHWLHTAQPHHHRVAARLCDYWQLPKETCSLLTLNAQDTRLNAIVGLSIAAVDVVQRGIHGVNVCHYDAFSELKSMFNHLNQQHFEDEGFSAYFELCWQAASTSHYVCSLPAFMRP